MNVLEKEKSQLLRPIEILLVDDDDDDVLLARKSLEKELISNRIHRVEDGISAMQYLQKEGPFKSVSRPDLILLDLNMPRMDGRSVLRHIKSDPQLKTIPVVVLTTSDDESDVQTSYECQANSFVTKPDDLNEFREMLQNLQTYWFNVVRLPSV